MKIIKVLFLCLVCWLPKTGEACSEQTDAEFTGFAKAESLAAESIMAGYEVYAPSVYRGYRLTSITASIPNVLAVPVEQEVAPDYPEYRTGYVIVGQQELPRVDIHFLYATLIDSNASVMCGANVQVTLSELLKAAVPKKQSAPPPKL